MLEWAVTTRFVVTLLHLLQSLRALCCFFEGMADGTLKVLVCHVFNHISYYVYGGYPLILTRLQNSIFW